MGEPRQDLEALEAVFPETYIGHLIYPTLKVAQRVGDIYFNDIAADSAAQTGRSVGTAPTAVTVASGRVAYSCSEVIKRYRIGFSEVEQMGGIEAADEIGARAAKKSVVDAIEGAIQTVIVGGSADANYSANAVVTAVRSAINNVVDCAGTLAVVMSWDTYNTIVEYTDVQERLTYTGVARLPGEVVRGVDPVIMAQVFGVQKCLIGDPDVWTTDDAIAIVKLPAQDQFSYKLRPEYGRNVVYQTDGSEFVIEVAKNDDARAWDYDCYAWYDLAEMNAEGHYLLTLSE